MPTNYFEGDDLTDDAILTIDTLKNIGVGTTPPRPIPKTLNLKDSDQFDYHSRNVRVTYPGHAAVTTTIIPDVILHCDTFDHFGKTGVYIGVPQNFVDHLRNKLVAQKIKVAFEDPGLASDDKYWWSRGGFLAAKKDSEYIFTIDQDENGGILEEPWPSFTEFFAYYGASAVANVTCTIKMSTKNNVAEKGAITGNEEWRMGLNITRVNVVDLVDVEKPRMAIAQKSIAGARDRARGRLAQRQKELAANANLLG